MSDKAVGILLGVGAAIALGVYLKRRAGCGCGCGGHAAAELGADQGDDDDPAAGRNLVANVVESVSSLLTPAPAATERGGCGCGS